MFVLDFVLLVVLSATMRRAHAPTTPTCGQPSPSKPEQMDIPIGTMMELPRACQLADQIVGTESVDFMSFGTNVSFPLYPFLCCVVLCVVVCVWGGGGMSGYVCA